MFHDEVTINLSAGKGGNGSASFRREKYIPRGGPDGGDGGNGGNVIIRASQHVSDLASFAATRELKAENGVDGAGRKMYGRAGEDLIIEVPIGTRIHRKTLTGWRLIVDLVHDGQERRLLSGGKGGLGNVHFATSTNQAPRFAQPGKPGDKGTYKFELQLIADVGIIGKPNAGKSTFLSVVTEAKPKIADYPFTTLSPVLGILTHYDTRLVLADIPGLIEGASEGKGLGHRFLRHIRRTKALVHFIDSLSHDYAAEYMAVRQELKAFDISLSEKLELVVITKGELISDENTPEFEEAVAKLRSVLPSNSHLFSKVSISAVTRQNISELCDELVTLVNNVLPS